jgi:peptidoglycan/xylan/chitin deacetylase (PgdA/CDA1 family)
MTAAAVSITVDVDGEAGLPDGGAGWEHRLSSRSERRYGLARGLPRVLAVLAEHGVRATFYVPGVTADRHPDEVRAVLAAGHELGHHGHTHRRPDTLEVAEQRDEVVTGLGVLTELAGVAPVAYRAPGWELTPATLACLAELGFAADSSLMERDDPYQLDAGLLELPVHWTLDDAPHFALTTDPEALLRAWIAEVDDAARHGGHRTITLHPEILGRPHRVDVLRRLLDHCRSTGAATAAHGDLAAGLGA